MALKLSVVVVLLIGCKFALAEVIDSVFDVTDACVKDCDKTYPLHTYPNAKHNGCCQRGCRFYSLVQFLGSSTDVTSTRDICQASCMEAYGRTNDRYACNIGCSNMATYAEKRSKQLPVDDSAVASNTLFDVFDNAKTALRVGWTLYVRDGAGVLVVEEMRRLPDNDQGGPEDDDPVDALLSDPSVRRQLEQPLGSALISQKHVKTLPEENPVILEVAESRGDSSGPSMDWLGCVSRRSGLPRWLLAATVLLAVVVIIWLCLATAATAPEQHVRFLGISADEMESLKFSCSLEEPLWEKEKGLFPPPPPPYSPPAPLHTAPLPQKMAVYEV